MKVYIAYSVTENCCYPKETLNVFKKKEDCIKYIYNLGKNSPNSIYPELLEIIDSSIFEFSFIYGKYYGDNYNKNGKFPGYATRCYTYEIEEFEVL